MHAFPLFFLSKILINPFFKLKKEKKRNFLCLLIKKMAELDLKKRSLTPKPDLKPGFLQIQHLPCVVTCEEDRL